ncbi:hydroxymethylglutaryl-CoA lyase [Exophiala aquamarina CBS 119918]|uniref:hydroxymethylglutaryl-CoA lyase n=1 Tax=Exophiala aquamarina CBS 119918 TaxID=1182545 RepID=A0A072PIB9_9EURO|nr:hydroxymethylglutaryl-CoA lyase [Exophiala aquamarina CBS 119918]KEF59068.1 hydroxymethylglutaryl-CoA lyase [Exophiala aquamarina CBS 119918]
MARGPSVRIVEVGPRDGLQNIKKAVPLEVKVELINRLSDAGTKYMEPTSIVSPRAIPQLQDNQALLSAPSIRRLIQRPDTRYPVLVPNLKGLEIAKTLGVKEICVFISATEGFSRANINCTVAEGLQRAKEVTETAIRSGISVRGAVSCIFSDPYDGPTDPAAVLNTVSSLLSYGCYEVLLGDTVGVGCPEDVRRLLTYLKEGGVDIGNLAGHFHDTYGQAVANAWAAYEFGIRTFDSAISGLGGCPFAPGAKGNVATEDLVYSFHKAGIQTGLDLSKLSATGEWISNVLQGPNNSRAGQAIARKSGGGSGVSVNIPAKKLQWHFIEQSPNLDILRSGVNVKIVLRRPRNGNALTSEMLTQLQSYIQKVSSDQSIARIIITAEGKFFCTGMDLSDKVQAKPARQEKKSDHAMFTELFETISKAPQVTIAAINGPCYAGGIGLAFACDIRIAVETASLTLSEVKLGLCPAIISEYLVREWGPSFTREAMLSARSISMTELKSIGAVHVLAKDVADLDHQLDSYLVNLRKAAPGASTLVKSVVEVGWSNPGGQRQRDAIKGIFEGMMKLGSESEIGLGAFRSKKVVDWDALKENVAKPKL